MVIDVDHFDPARRRQLDRGEVARAAVAGDDHVAAACREIFSGLSREAISGVAARDRALDVRSGRAQERGQQRSGGDAVDVVVAEHADALVLLDGTRDAVDGDGEAGEAGGRTERGETRIDETLRICRLDDAARDEAARGCRPHTQGTGDTVDEPSVEGANAHLHACTLGGWSDTETR